VVLLIQDALRKINAAFEKYNTSAALQGGADALASLHRTLQEAIDRCGITSGQFCSALDRALHDFQPLAHLHPDSAALAVADLRSMGGGALESFCRLREVLLTVLTRTAQPAFAGGAGGGTLDNSSCTMASALLATLFEVHGLLTIAVAQHS